MDVGCDKDYFLVRQGGDYLVQIWNFCTNVDEQGLR